MKQGLLIGGLVGAILALLTVVGGTVSFIHKKSSDMRRGWMVVPIAVTARALKHGERIGAGALVARETPEQFVTASTIPAAKLGTLDQRILTVDLPPNAIIRCADLESEKRDPVRECIRRAVTK